MQDLKRSALALMLMAPLLAAGSCSSDVGMQGGTDRLPSERCLRAGLERVGMKASTELRLSSRSFSFWGKERPRYHSMLFAVDSYQGGVAFAPEGERFRVNLSVYASSPLDKSAVQKITKKLERAYAAWQTTCGGRWDRLTLGPCTNAECP